MSANSPPRKDRSWREDYFAGCEVWGNLGFLCCLLAILIVPMLWGGFSSATAKKQNLVIAYCAQDQGYAEPIFRELRRQTGIRVRAVYDSEAVKTVGMANRLLAERPHPQCDVFWGNEELRTRQLAAQGVFRETNGWAAVGYRSLFLAAASLTVVGALLFRFTFRVPRGEMARASAADPSGHIK